MTTRLRPALLLLALVAAAPAPAQDTVEYVPTALSETVTMIQGRGGNIAVSAGEDGVFIIDDQYTHLVDQLLAAIGAVSEQPIRFVINTHYHGDHVGGNETIGQAGAVIIAHDNIRKRMSTEQFNTFFKGKIDPWPKGALPVVTFSDRASIHMNGESITVHHAPHAHTDGDGIVHFPGSNVVHMGDVFFNQQYPYIDLDAGGSIDGLIAAVELGLQLSDEETRVIPGHGPLTDREGLQAYHAMLMEVRSRVQALIDQGKTLQEAVEAKPTAPWDEVQGGKFIKPDNLVIFVYNSLTGVDYFTPLEGEKTSE